MRIGLSLESSRFDVVASSDRIAKASGQALGRPTALAANHSGAQQGGAFLSVLAVQYGVSRAAIQRVQKRAA